MPSTRYQKALGAFEAETVWRRRELQVDHPRYQKALGAFEAETLITTYARWSPTWYHKALGAFEAEIKA